MSGWGGAPLRKPGRVERRAPAHFRRGRPLARRRQLGSQAVHERWIPDPWWEIVVTTRVAHPPGALRHAPHRQTHDSDRTRALTRAWTPAPQGAACDSSADSSPPATPQQHQPQRGTRPDPARHRHGRALFSIKIKTPGCWPSTTVTTQSAALRRTPHAARAIDDHQKPSSRRSRQVPAGVPSQALLPAAAGQPGSRRRVRQKPERAEAPVTSGRQRHSLLATRDLGPTPDDQAGVRARTVSIPAHHRQVTRSMLSDSTRRLGLRLPAKLTCRNSRERTLRTTSKRVTLPQELQRHRVSGQERRRTRADSSALSCLDDQKVPNVCRRRCVRSAVDIPSLVSNRANSPIRYQTICLLPANQRHTSSLTTCRE